MFKEAKVMSLIVETPLHAGSGSDLGIVDLPIQRERHTNFPKIEASGLKGCLREILDPREEPNEAAKEIAAIYKRDYIYPTFGPENGDEHAGALGFTDARLLLFPVKSLKGVFVWITCPMVLERLQRDLEMAKLSFPEFDPAALENTVPSTDLCINSSIVLEEYAFEVKQDETCKKFAEWCSINLIPAQPAYQFWQTKMKTDLVVVRDKDFQDFVTMSTEVIARTRIDDTTGTVADGALWYEEYLPADTILYALILASPPFTKITHDDAGNDTRKLKTEKDVMKFFETNVPAVIQVGGNATIGKGFVRTKIL